MREYEHREPTAGSGGAGIFIQDVTIDSVNDLSGTAHPRLKDENGNPRVFDLYLLLSLEIGQSFKPTFEVFGNLSRDAAGTPTDWGSAFKVGELFHNCGIKLALDANNKIPADFLTAMVGKKFALLKFIAGVKKDGSGKPLWVSWDITGVAGEHEKLQKYFIAQVKKGKIKKYAPTAGQDASFDPQQFAGTAAAPDSPLV